MDPQEHTDGGRWHARWGSDAGDRGRGHHESHGFGGHGRGIGHGGGGFEALFRQAGPRATRGDVRGAALLLLEERPMHGYQIIQELGNRTSGVWQPSAGSVYPALQQLEDEGLARGEETEGRHVYTLTDAGGAYVAERRAELTEAFQAVSGAVGDDVMNLRTLYQQVGAALGQVIQAGTPAQMVSARDLLATTRRRLYQLLADEPGEPE
jgi:DNA-binding PadR family transcriptional regulator